VAARGFTLIELLVAVALLAILATLAAPGLGEYLRNCRRAATVNALSHSIHAARALASVRGQAIILCPSTDAAKCTGGRDWSHGLLIRPDEPDEAAAGTPPLRRIQLAAATGRQSVRSNRDSIRFAALLPAATTATLVVCDDRGSRAARAVIISRTGRPRVSERDASGRKLECP
jgi:type IV fimbrial biogenesis protein FimT